MTPFPTAKVLITGAGGQLGLELQGTAPTTWQVVACGSRELDVTDQRAVEETVKRERPAVVINAAAYTGVDDAESDAARAHAVNAEGAGHLANAAQRLGARVIHVSTDFVFDGAQGRPYTPADLPNPLGVYGRSKLAGERLVQDCTMGAALIVRTAWVYAAQGKNFVGTMLRLMRERDSVSVVCDQVGTPTWGRTLAQALWVAAEHPNVRGILHWTDAGVASWYDFAVAIQEEALAQGLLDHTIPVRPIRTEEFPRPARCPSYSVLDKTDGWAALGGPARHWRANLRGMLRGVPRA